MIELGTTVKTTGADEKRRTSLFIRRSFRQGRRAQTLVEYALIMAYISVVSMQAMQLVGFAALQQYIYINCTTIVANTNNQNLSTSANEAAEMTAVNNYLSATSTWRNYPTSWVTPAQSKIYTAIHNIVYGS